MYGKTVVVNFMGRIESVWVYCLPETGQAELERLAIETLRRKEMASATPSR